MRYDTRSTVLSALFLCAATAWSSADHVITVDDDGQDLPHADFASLSEAVAAAADYQALTPWMLSKVTIRMAPGTYGLVETLEMPVGGLLVLKGVEGAEKTTINASSIDVGIDIQGGVISLQGVKLRTRGSLDPDARRIGVQCSEAHLSIEDCIFSSLQSTGDGGDVSGIGLLAEHSTVHMQEVVFRRYADVGLSLVECRGGEVADTVFRNCNVAMHVDQGVSPAEQEFDLAYCSFVGNYIALLLENPVMDPIDDRSWDYQLGWPMIEGRLLPIQGELGLTLRVEGSTFERNTVTLWNIREHTESHDELVFSGCWFEDMHLYPEDCWIDGGGNSSS